MELKRTANAGVLLELDGVTILMDGVCREVKPYPATPPEVKAQLMEDIPNAVAFTHAHKDHYDPGFAAHVLQKNGVILGPSDCHGTMEPVTVGAVRITPVFSRHIGIAGKYAPHASFIVEGSSCVWFTGDAAPTQWRLRSLPKPDLLIVPYAYCNTPAAWEATKSLGAKAVVLVHMPNPEEDTLGLWDAVKTIIGEKPSPGEKVPPKGADVECGRKTAGQYPERNLHCHFEERSAVAISDPKLTLYIPNMNEALTIQLPHD